jgi:hypothetical protein
MTAAPAGWPLESFAVEKQQKIFRPALLMRRALSCVENFHD